MIATLPTFRIGQGKECVYCGDSPSGLDHIIPVSFQTLTRKPKNRRRDYGPLAFACFDCNQGFCERQFDTFDARCQFARDRIAKKAKPIHWTEAQLQELDYKLQTYARHSTQLYRWLRDRADWYESANYIRNLEALQWERALRQHQFFAAYFAPTLALITEYYANWGKGR